jgi:PAS domain S-box-containing protein
MKIQFTMLTNETANILLVDDKANNIFALEQVLSRPGRNFIRALSGKDALKTVLNGEIDLIILDVQMPDMDGFEVAQILKSNKRSKDIPIIFASAEKKEYRFMIKGFEEGAIDYLYKPLDPIITEAKVAVLLQLHLQKKELLRKNEALEKYALLIDNSADLICIINPRTLEFEEVNYAVNAMLGYSVEEFKGASVLSFLSGEDCLIFRDLCKENKEKFSFETRAHCKEKDIKWLHWNIVNKNGLWFANARDITWQKKTDQEIHQLNTDLSRNVVQLEAANRELESFTYSVSHDLRAPLRGINLYVGKILQDHHTNLDEDPKRLFGNIQANAKRMGILIDDLLAFSKLGRRTVKMAPVNLNEVVSQVIKDLEQAGSSCTAITIGVLPSPEGDRALLYQAFLNLISNSIKYSGKKSAPEIGIGSLENEDEYVYYVKDNGAGFDMAYVHKLFGVFQRLHNEEDFEGTGVGLAIVHRIITKHGGKVWAEGQPGKGAIFYFSLPRPIQRIKPPPEIL